MKMPVVFIGHGSPMSVLPENKYNKAWKKLGQELPKPKAILVISAHWNIDSTSVSDRLEPKQIYDFYGFPDELYKINYKPVGSAELADEIIENIHEIADININNDWGIDHGAWVPLSALFPKADIPVMQLSLDYAKPAEFHYNLGKSLSFLREQGVLIIGSGDIVHNLGILDFDEDAKPFDWAENFEEEVIKHISNKNHSTLINYQEINHNRLAIPTPEHYLPLLYILGLQDEDDKLEYFVKDIAHGSISMTSFILK